MQRLNFDVFLRVIFTFFNHVKYKKYDVIVGLRFMYVLKEHYDQDLDLHCVSLR